MFANSMIEMIYGTSANPDDLENQTIDFQDGYAVGYEDDRSGSPAIVEEYQRRGFTDQVDASFKEWKRGFWAGSWTRIEEKL